MISMVKRKTVHRILAYMMTICLVISCISIPSWTAKADSISLDLNPDTIEYTVTVTESGVTSQLDINIAAPSAYNTVQALIDAGYTELTIGYRVSKYTAYSGGTPGVLPYIAHGDSWKYTTDGWKNLSDANEGTVTIALSNATASDELKRFGLLICNVTGEVTYQITSAVLTGTGSSSGGGGTGGGGTEITTDVEYNYAKLLQESLYFYDANMCGYLEGKCALSWRGNCHTYDSNVTYTSNGKTYSVDASGGFHDAGDHVKFGLPQGYSASMLGMSYYEFGDAFDELEQTEHLKKITNYFCDYFRRCTVYDDSGNVIAFCYQVGNGHTDHSIWSAPENQTLDRPAYFADSSNPATDEVSVAIAALALNYKNFGNAEDLKVAEDLFAFVQKNSKACATEGAWGFYSSETWQDDYALAAAALWIATGESSYKSEYESNKGGINQYWVLDWANSGAMASMLAGDTSILAKVANFCKNTSANVDGVFNCVSDWGSCRYNAAEGFVGLVYDRISGKNTYNAWATSQMNYMIGDNPSKRCYIVGYNGNSSQYPHHRAASRSTDAAITRADHYTLLGALVGGPGKNGYYADKQDDYNCNEVALDYNAGLVGIAAGLYLTHKNDSSVYLSYEKANTTNYSTALAKKEELSSIGVTTYYGTSTSEEPSSEEVTTEEPSTEEPVIKVESIHFDKTSITLYVGESDSIMTEVKPSDAADKSLAWSSSDSAVVSVSDGKITALSKGTATITATAKDGSGISANCSVTVKDLGRLTADKENINMGQFVYGYTNSDTESAKASVIVTNIGEKAVEGVSVVLDKGSSFELANVPAQSISAGGAGTITLKVKQSLNTGTYYDTIKVTSDSGSFNIPVSVKVIKAESDTTVQLKVNAKTYSEIALSADITGSSNNIEYAIATEKDADTTKLIWQDVGTFSNLNEFTTYYLYARSKEDANHNSGKISDALEVTTLVCDPYTIDISKITLPNGTINNTYLEALKDADGVSTVKAELKAGVPTLSLVNPSKPYVITGSNGKLVVSADGVSDITLKNAELNKLELYMSGSGSVNIKTEGTNKIQSGITLNQDKTDAAAELILSSNDKNGVLHVSSTDKPAIEAIEKLTIVSGNITISSDYQCISAGSVEISGGNVQASVIGKSDGRPAIEAEKEITLLGGSISVTTPSETDISFGVSEAGRIVIDGDAAITGKPVYSTEPVDKNGNKLSTVNVIFTDDIGNTLKTYQIKTGSALHLEDIIIKNSEGIDYAASKEDYSLSWTDGSNIYTTDQRIENINGDITLKAVWTWKVVDISKTSISAIKAVAYTGKAVCPAVSVTYKNNKLTANTDYKLTYKNNVNAGTASVTITGIYKYSGSVTKSFTINKKSIAGGNVKTVSSAIYTGSAIKPSVTVTCAFKTLKSGTDYTVTYKNNKNIGKASIVISGKGNYTGTITKTFNITVKKGKVYKVGNYKYKITNAATNGKGTVTLTGTTKKRATVVIKSTVKIGGKSFKVTAIGDKAFRKNKTIKKLTIPSSVTKIGKQAFYGCSKLKTITIHSMKLKSKNIGTKAFKEIYKKAVIKVPKAKLKTYKKLLKAKGVSAAATIKKK